MKAIFYIGVVIVAMTGLVGCGGKVTSKHRSQQPLPNNLVLMSAWVGARGVPGAQNLRIASAKLTADPLLQNGSGQFPKKIWEIDFSGTFNPPKKCHNQSPQGFPGALVTPPPCNTIYYHSITVEVSPVNYKILGIVEPALQKVVVPPLPTPTATSKHKNGYAVP